MDKAFITALDMSITAGWVILAILVLRQLLKRAPRWITCLLWTIPALRLLFPFSIESVVSAFNVLPGAKTVTTEILYDPLPSVNTGIPQLNQAINPVLQQSFTPEPSYSVNPLQIVSVVAANIWVLGVIVLAIYTVVSYVRLRRRLAPAILLTDNVYQCEAAASPFIFGVLWPRIYMPYGISAEHMKEALAHERAHIARRDHIWKPLAFAIASAYWFNPLVWVGYVFFCRDIEYACDQRVLKDSDMQRRKQYSTALLELAVVEKRLPSCPLAFGEVSIRDRVKKALIYKKPALWVIIAAVVICAVAAVCLMTDPVEQPEPADASPVGEYSMSRIANGAEEPITDVPPMAWQVADSIISDFNRESYITSVAVDPNSVKEGFVFTIAYEDGDSEEYRLFAIDDEAYLHSGDRQKPVQWERYAGFMAEMGEEILETYPSVMMRDLTGKDTDGSIRTAIYKYCKEVIGDFYADDHYAELWLQAVCSMGDRTLALAQLPPFEGEATPELYVIVNGAVVGHTFGTDVFCNNVAIVDGKHVAYGRVGGRSGEGDYVVAHFGDEQVRCQLSPLEFERSAVSGSPHEWIVAEDNTQYYICVSETGQALDKVVSHDANGRVTQEHNNDAFMVPLIADYTFVDSAWEIEPQLSSTLTAMSFRVQGDFDMLFVDTGYNGRLGNEQGLKTPLSDGDTGPEGMYSGGLCRFEPDETVYWWPFDENGASVHDANIRFELIKDGKCVNVGVCTIRSTDSSQDTGSAMVYDITMPSWITVGDE